MRNEIALSLSYWSALKQRVFLQYVCSSFYVMFHCDIQLNVTGMGAVSLNCTDVVYLVEDV